jgi:hypothetical protein
VFPVELHPGIIYGSCEAFGFFPGIFRVVWEWFGAAWVAAFLFLPAGFVLFGEESDLVFQAFCTTFAQPQNKIEP